MQTKFVMIFIIAVLAGCAPSEPKEIQPLRLESKPDEVIERKPEISAEIVARTKAATVLIGNFENGKLVGTGTGFVAGDGKTIFTNAHVVTGSDETIDSVKVLFGSGGEKQSMLEVKPESISIRDGYTSKSKYSNKDIASIVIPKKVVEPLTFGILDKLHETMSVWAFGFPAGINIATTKSNKLPSPTVHSLKIERLEQLDGKVVMIQVGGSTTFGNSGGCLIDEMGAVVGIVQAKQAESITYAVPASAIENFQNEVKGLIAQGSGDDKQITIKDFVSPPKSAAKEKTQKPKPRSTENKHFVATRSVLADGLVTADDLDGLSAFELTMLRNEPFARRGYIFQRAELRRAFEKHSWYEQVTKDIARIQQQMSRTERANVDFIKRYQDYNGLTY